MYHVLALSLYLHDRVRKITVQPRTSGAIRAFFAAQFPSQMPAWQAGPSPFQVLCDQPMSNFTDLSSGTEIFAALTVAQS